MIDFVNTDEYTALGRDKFIKDFTSHITHELTTGHICLNGGWGTGKTGIIHHIIKDIRESAQTIETFYFDTWYYENSKVPIYALIAAMKKIKPEFYDLFKKSYKSKFGFDFTLNLQLVEFNFNNQYTVMDQVNDGVNYLNEIAGLVNDSFVQFKDEGKTKLIVFIDELDRCKPEFAMQVLEQFHHFENTDDIVFVYSVDKEQLKGMVNHYYGINYNSSIFFQKVFEREFKVATLSEESMKQYVLKRINDKQMDSDLVKFIFESEVIYGLTLRNLNNITMRINNLLESEFINALNQNSANQRYNGFLKFPRFYYPIFVAIIVWQETGLFNIDDFLVEKDYSRLLKLYRSLTYTSQFDELIEATLGNQFIKDQITDIQLEKSFKNIFEELSSHEGTYAFLKEYF